MEKAYLFEGGSNFRDLGGYRTCYGTRVRYGMLIRGPRLCDLTQKDRTEFDKLGIKTILDLRSLKEAEDGPDYIPREAVYYRECGMRGPTGEEIDFSPDNLIRNFGEITFESFSKVYSSMAFKSTAIPRAFQIMEEKNTPLFFHCTSGKDRTGILAMIILLALGVSIEDALYDYTLTNKYNADKIQSLMNEHGVTDPNSREYKELLPMNGVDPLMAESTISKILSLHGNIESYLCNEYGITQSTISSLRKHYTEKVQ